MALPPQLASLALGPQTAPHVLELYIDYLCPFSAKIFFGFVEHALPLIAGADAPFRDSVRVVLRPVPQPWHASSTLLHEGAIAAAHLALPDAAATAAYERNAFWQASHALFKNQERWFDGAVVGKTFDGVRDEIAQVVAGALGAASTASQAVERDVRAQTRVAEGNAGASVVPDLKYAIKIGRQNGIHVTPTALWNGVVEPGVSSSFGRSEWSAFFESHVPRAKA